MAPHYKQWLDHEEISDVKERVGALDRLLQEPLLSEKEEFVKELRDVIHQMLSDEFNEWYTEDPDFVEPEGDVSPEAVNKQE